jgi:putative PIN family toxin of toxin-antitoxin system
VRVFLDTNVLASAATTRGLCADVLREVFARHELLLSNQVLSELSRVLKSKFGEPEELVDSLLWLLQQDTVRVEPAILPQVELQDQDDLGILGAAVQGGAEVLVTGDRELLTLSRVESVVILSPRQFWERLKTAHRQQAKGRRRRRSR